MLLDLVLWRRVVDLESRASAALQQALSEEERLGLTRQECAVELGAVAIARATLQVGDGANRALGGLWREATSVSLLSYGSTCTHFF